MNNTNKQFLHDNYALKEQAEAGTLVLSEEQKREFYKILHEEVDEKLIVNLYSQENVNEMVKTVFNKYNPEQVTVHVKYVEEEHPTLKTTERKTTVPREEVTKAVKTSTKKKK